MKKIFKINNHVKVQPFRLARTPRSLTHYRSSLPKPEERFVSGNFSPYPINRHALRDWKQQVRPAERRGCTINQANNAVQWQTLGNMCCCRQITFQPIPTRAQESGPVGGGRRDGKTKYMVAMTRVYLCQEFTNRNVWFLAEGPGWVRPRLGLS